MAARPAVAVSSRWIDATSGRCATAYSSVTVAAVGEVAQRPSGDHRPYPFSDAYAGASSSATPKPGCQRRSCAGRCE
ncbi:hypothetical protein [Nocardioides sp. KR10-350]|uniref:hypothetical protein n=1 Tax=Nocardioides cheoyonin TaxID=3156615 RepID=UPI0032B53F33